MPFVDDPDPLLPLENPRFAEAYPRIDFLKGQRAIAEGRTICVFERRGKARLGQFSFGSYEADEPHERGLMHGLVHIWPDQHLRGREFDVAFRIRSNPIGVNHIRDYALCESCEKRKTVLVYVKDWKCRQCHGLLTRSQLIDPRLRLYEEIGDLEKRVAKGRPKGMHQATYEAKLEELQVLNRRVAQMPRNTAKVVAAEHDRIVTSRWVNVTEDWEVQSMFAEYPSE